MPKLTNWYTKYKFPVLFVYLMIVALIIAACGGGAGSNTPTASQPAAGTGEMGASNTPVPTIVATPPAIARQATGVPDIQCKPDQKQLVWMVRNGPVENQWEANIVRPEFQKAHPEICLKILSINQDDIAVKRQAMIAAGEPLHVWSPNWDGDGFASDRIRGLIADLTPLIQRDNFDLSVFDPNVLKIYQIDGKTWALPFLTTGSFVYYNKELFDKAGVPYPPTSWDDTSWTWDKFIATAKKLTKNTNNLNKAQFGAANGLWPPVDAIGALWGYWIIPDEAQQTGFSDGVQVVNDRTIKAFQAIHDLVYKDKVAPNNAAVSALTQLGGVFESGRVAMFMTGGWGHWAYHPLIDDPNGFCWGAAPLPMGTPDAKRRAVLFTDPWVITANLSPEEQDLAWTFIKFLVSEDQARKYMEATGTPPTQTKLMQEYYKQFSKCMKPEDMKEVFEGAFSHGRESSNHLLVKFDELNQIWDNGLATFWNNPNAKAEDVLKKIEPQFNSALKRIKAEEGQ